MRWVLWLLFGLGLSSQLSGCVALHSRSAWSVDRAEALPREALLPPEERIFAQRTMPEWCPSPWETAAAETAGREMGAAPNPGAAALKVYFGSNRDFSMRGGVDRSAERRDTNQYGECVVTIPDRHQFGELERPSIWRFDFRESAQRHVVLQSAQQLDREECLARMQRDLEATREPDLFVFVHGYNVTFAEAALRTAQMAYDLRFAGVPVFYSWPSEGRMTSYGRDVRVADQSVGCVAEFLTTLARDSGARRIHLVAHSLGNRALIGALAQLATDPAAGDLSFDEVVFASPDLDADQFAEVLAPRIEPVIRRATVYTSGSDLALWAAKLWHRTFRLGQRGPHWNTMEGFEWIEVVDATAVGFEWFELGHSAYGGELLVDLKRVIAGQPRLVPAAAPVARGRESSIPWNVGRPVLPTSSRSRIMPPLDRWR